MKGLDASLPATDYPFARWLLGLGGMLLGIAGAMPFAGGWNDGSRLATVESIVDRHTLAIDDSSFCQPPADAIRRGCPPYPGQDQDLLANGTRDKLLIGGHFYSDKPAVISGLMAVLYQTGQWLGLPRAMDRPDLFCWVLTVSTAGLAYAVALICLYRLGVAIGLTATTLWVWVASFALATVAPTYTRHVNNHILLLAVVAAICLQIVHLARDAEAGVVSRWRLLGLGTLAGLGYNLDLGAGPLLLAGMLALIVYRCRRPSAAVLFLLAAVPWLAAGLGVNFAMAAFGSQ